MGTQLMEFSPEFSCYTIGQPGYEYGEDEARPIHKEIFEGRCYDITPLALYHRYRGQYRVILARHETKIPLIDNPRLSAHAGISPTLRISRALGGSKDSTERLTYYPNTPANSTFVPEEKEKLRQMSYRVLGPEKTDIILGDATETPVIVERLSYFRIVQTSP
ncbi:hypothetical protein FQN53_003741 [Emmonsiellopsis sp. PD_33]|nr:hypothetical protein FQN53_003741 [Emmonsiellopsis sp. PD_33]